MDYAHAGRIFRSALADDSVKRWVDAQQRPYSKLMRGFYSNEGIVQILGGKGFDYSALIGTSKVSEGAVFVFKNLIYPKEERSTAWRKVQEQLYKNMDKKSVEAASLNKLGCPVISPMWHSYEISDEADPSAGTGVDLWFFLPFNKPNPSFGHNTIGMPPQPRTLPNFEGQVTFLAYLMRKGYVTEEDAPCGEDPKAPFSAAMFGFAKARAGELSL